MESNMLTRFQERGRLAGLSGDKMLSPPVICQIGQEAWRAKEAKATTEEVPHWGPAEERGQCGKQ